jgi:hypothetical protein
MPTLQLTGSLVAGASCATACGDSSGTLTLPLSFPSCGKQYQVSVGTPPGAPRSINSLLAFTAISSIGAGGDVTRGEFLYVASEGTLDLELTTDDGSGGNVVAVVPIDSGPTMWTFPSTKYLKGLRVRGVGRLIYFVAGPQ